MGRVASLLDPSPSTKAGGFSGELSLMVLRCFILWISLYGRSFIILDPSQEMDVLFPY